MKTFEISIRLRNNRLLQRRTQLGLNQAQLCRAAGVQQSAYASLEGLKQSPIGYHPGFRGKGARPTWRIPALRLAKFHGVPVEELFPDDVLEIQKTEVVRKIDRIELALTGNPDRFPQLTDSPEDALLSVEKHAVLDKCMQCLTPREELVLRERSNGKTLDEVAALAGGCGRERIRQIELKAIRKIHDRVKNLGREIADVFAWNGHG